VTRNRPRILVTRPADQANRLCELIEAAGGEALRLPTIEILDPLDTSHLENVVDELDSCDLAVFVSTNAVIRGMEYILTRREWPEEVQIATVGTSSAASLLRFGLAADLVPATRFTSEGLLELDELQDMSGMRVIIVRGSGGRELLHDTLVERGAEVDYAEVYRRACPVVEARVMRKLLKPGYLDVITVTSNETLQNLFTMAGPEGQALLRNIPLLVGSERQARRAAELGFSQAPVIAADTSDAATVAALKQTVMRKDADRCPG
jgi:uroporphyrinogen-III synthase